MFLTKVRRVIKSGFINFWRGGVVSLSAVLVLVITLFVIGSLLFFAQAVLDSALTQIKDKVDVTVYFKLDSNEKDIVAMREFLLTMPEVTAVDYVSRDEALVRFRERHKDNSTIIGALDEIGDNPLGASITIKAKEPSQYENIARLLQGDQGTVLSSIAAPIKIEIIDEVTYFKNKLIIDRLSNIIVSTNRIGFAVALILSFMAILVTFNTIRLVIYIAREEIAVMKLVGASNNYVRGPFIVEGALCGTIAALVVMVMFWGFTAWLAPATESFFGGLNLYVYFKANFLNMLVMMLGIGVVLASLSSYLAVRQYLKV